MSLKAPEKEEIGRRRLPRLLVLYGVTPALLIGVAVAYSHIVDFVERDPAFCGLCHQTQSQYALWTASEHHNIVCQGCHHETRGEALSVLTKFVVQGRSGDENVGNDAPMHEPAVPIDSCARCHLTHDRNWPQIGSSIGHKVHVVDAQVSCMRCHARSIHKFAAAQESCGECHEEHVEKADGMERLHCLACHNFLSTEETMKPSRKVCLDCHRSSGLLDPTFPENAPMANLPCWACHHPHSSEDPKQVACVECHDQMDRHGLHELEAHEECGDCHEPHTWTATRRNCTECHRDKVSHYAHEKCWACHAMSARKEAGGEQ